ncbi:hypothetical protein KR009_002679 [Drosophila setifemur]|nr:hypothetical protein KR009_002679 [Drosophila setifemur]
MNQNYFFDVIMVTSSLPIPRPTATSVSGGGCHIYSVRIFEDFEELPMERLFVEEFPQHPLGQFTASPCDLIGSLTSKGICVTLKQNDELLGAGNAQLSPANLRQLTEPTFTVTESLLVELKEKKNSVGVVELIIKLGATDPNVHRGLVAFGCYDVCRPVDQSINQRDLIFTLGRSEKCGTHSCITDERLMSHAGAPFQCPHASAKAQGGDGEASGATGGCGCFVAGMQVPPDEQAEKKKEKAALKSLIDELGIDKVKAPTPPRSHMQSRNWQYKSSKTDTSTDTCSSGSRKWGSKRRKSLALTASQKIEARKTMLGKCPSPLPDLVATPYKPPTLCQLCQSDISWLPKVSACPYCGYKTFEGIQSSERPYDHAATAQQLLEDSLRKETCEWGSDAKDKEEELDGIQELKNLTDSNLSKPCVCLGEKPCTRCRIRKLCDIFTDNEYKSQSLPQAQAEGPAESKPPDSPTKSRSLKKSNSTTSQRRTQLVSIFKEMHQMYGRKKGASEEEALMEQQRKECESACRNTKSAKARRRARKSLQKALKEIDRAYPKPPKMRVKKKKAKRPRSKCYTFLKVQKRPNNPRIGHVDCISDSNYTGYCKVPCHMGWMWTKSEMARYKSWRPGAISKPCRQLMTYFLQDFPADNICLSRYHYRRRKGAARAEPEDEELVQHPTLHISRKGDDYIITLRPLKDPNALAVCANPYANMKPVVFRITKDPMAVVLKEMRVALQEKGMAPCTCGRPVASCYCRSHIDKKMVETEVSNQCRERGIPDNTDTFVYSPNSDDDDSDNEYEFGVTPPAGIIKPERLFKPDKASVETQYMEQDWAQASLYPHPANMLVQYGACVMGERKAPFPWLYGKGNVHAEPKKPLMRNIPKKKPRKQLPFRSKGGFDNPSIFDPSPLNRPWRKSHT